MDTQELLSAIKSSKKYRDLSEEIILKEINKSQTKDIKEIKSRLHMIASSFRTTKKNKAARLLEDLKQARLKRNKKEQVGVIKELLCTNRSTKERVEGYTKLYTEILKITGKQQVIADLGAGLNPISYIYLGYTPKYIGYDIDLEEKKICNEFFNILGINGKSIVLDCSNLKNLEEVNKQNPDIAFMFKFIDPIEKANGKGHKLSEEIINQLNAKLIVISFATKTLSGRKMRYAKRGWFERMLNRLEFKWQVIELDNEIFYVIRKI
jgi:hypothetical protein